MAVSCICDTCSRLQKLWNRRRDGWIDLELTLEAWIDQTRNCFGICQTFQAAIHKHVDSKSQVDVCYLSIYPAIVPKSITTVHGYDRNHESLFRLQLYANHECGSSRPDTEWPWAMFRLGRILPSRSDSPQCIQYLQGWFENCQTQHEMCKRHIPKDPVKVRMLHVQAESVRLLEGFGLEGRFAALSHCWGDGKHITTTKKSLNAHLTGIPMEQLPRSFQDAVSICKVLKLEYIWIDSLCIIQDDAKDWESEARKMGLVYKHAELVIAASAAKSSSGGLFHSRKPPSRVLEILEQEATAGGELFVRDGIRHTQYTYGDDDTSGHDPLQRRAWVLQEWLLARRVIHFASQEIVWDCRQCLACECGGIDQELDKVLRQADETYQPFLREGLFRALTRPQQDAKSSISLWKQVVTEFTSRMLTKSTDRLIAISGLASELASSDPKVGRYLGGLFEHELATQLLWNSVTVGAAQARPADVVAPSWSWASISDPAHWLKTWPPISDNYIEDRPVLDMATVNVEDDGEDQFGARTRGRLLVRTRVLSGHIVNSARTIQGLRHGMCYIRTARPSDNDQKEEMNFYADVDLTELIARSDGQDIPVTAARIVSYQAPKSDEMVVTNDQYKDGDGDKNEDIDTDTSTTFTDPYEVTGPVCGSLILLPQSAPDLKSSSTSTPVPFPPMIPRVFTRIGVNIGSIPVSWYDEAEERLLVVV